MPRRNRRDFLRTAAVSTAAIAVSGVKASGNVLGANDDIRLGVIGVGSKVGRGGQGARDMEEFRKIPGVRVVALCDVDSDNLGREAAKFQARHEKVATYSDLRKLLDNKNVDAVTIATPNHWHALATVWACQAGKDVFVQKVASHNIFEGRKMVEAARKYDRIVQCDNGSRTPSGLWEALDYVRQGKLGKIVLMRGIIYDPRTSIGKVKGPQPIPSTVDYDLWCGPVPVEPLMRERLHYEWHWDWRYGNGEYGNIGIHRIDGCRMAIGDTLPPRVITIGGRFGYDDDGQTPNTFIVYLDYQPAPILFEIRDLPKDKSRMKGGVPHVDNWGRNAMDDYQGISEGIIIQCENGSVIHAHGTVAALDTSGRQIKQFQPTTAPLKQNFIQAVRSRRAGDLLSDVLQGHLSAALIHMGNIAHRVGKPAADAEITERIQGNKDLVDCYERFKTHLSANGIDLDKTPATLGAMLTMDSQSERFVGEFSEAANKLVSRQYRPPFVVPEEV